MDVEPGALVVYLTQLIWPDRAAGSSILQHVELTIVPNAACQNEYARSSRIHITSTQLCAGGELGKDSCDGKLDFHC